VDFRNQWPTANRESVHRVGTENIDDWKPLKLCEGMGSVVANHALRPGRDGISKPSVLTLGAWSSKANLGAGAPAKRRSCAWWGGEPASRAKRRHMAIFIFRPSAAPRLRDSWQFAVFPVVKHRAWICRPFRARGRCPHP